MYLFHITDQGHLHYTKHPNVFQGEQVTVATSPQMRHFFASGHGMHPSSTNCISQEGHSIDTNTKFLSLSMYLLKKNLSGCMQKKKIDENYE